MPMNLSSRAIEVGAGNSVMALTFKGRGRIPALDTRWPRKSISSTPKTHFSVLTTRPCSARRQTAIGDVLCVQVWIHLQLIYRRGSQKQKPGQRRPNP